MLNNFRGRPRESGLVSPKPFFRKELVTNGTFDTDVSGWSVNSPATIVYSSGAANLARNSSSYRADMIYQDIYNFLIGEYYAFSVQLTAISGSQLYMELSGIIALVGNVTNLTTYAKIFQATANSARLAIALPNNLTGTATIDNVSIKHIDYYASL